jgi:hypothetical protein
MQEELPPATDLEMGDPHLYRRAPVGLILAAS